MRSDCEAQNQIDDQGPEVLQVWKSVAPPTERWSYEYPLFSDAHLTGEILSGLGPFEILNGLSFPGPTPSEPLPVLVLRVSVPLPGQLEPPDEWSTSHENYHGGSFVDEVAALISLALGVRFKAGTETRTFQPGSDPKGHPRGGSQPPTLSRRDRNLLVVPSAAGIHGLNDCEKLLSSLAEIPSDAAFALVIAARTYQQALWLCESEPETAWLLLVSAIERAANFWNPMRDEPLESVRGWNPKLCKYLELLGTDTATQAAKQFSGLIGASRKFRSFLVNFGPPEREPRPNIGALDWSEDSLLACFKKIYSYRSKALHEGTPFPYPMCQAPEFYDQTRIYNEVPLGLAARARGGTWLIEDMPMLLHVFEFIARNSLVKWWGSLSGVGPVN
jgi:hypothetical protein